MMVEKKRLLVVSAHAADYVWRAGGVIAQYVKGGADVEVIVLSFGVRGESNDLWKTPGQTAEAVKEIRKRETLSAAKFLGLADLEFWDLEDYPIRFGAGEETRMVQKIRTFRPDIILTHDRFDVLNPDHNSVSDFVFRCSVMSNSAGVVIGGTRQTRQMGLFGFEPHQTELSRYQPGCFIDITDSFQQKVAAMKCFEAQKHLIEYYAQRAEMRGNHARRLSGNQAIRYAESFSRVFPPVTKEFI